MIKDARINYIGYFRQVDAGVRKAALEQHHVDRAVADNVLFPIYFPRIVYAALSCTDSGLPNYGPIAVFLRESVAPLRATLLIENSFRFLDKHYKYRQPLPAGYFAAWANRAQLAVVKHAANITDAMPDAEVGHMILRPSPDRGDDDFIEVYIYDGFDKRAIDRIVLNETLANPRDQDRWQELTDSLTSEGIEFGSIGAKS